MSSLIHNPKELMNLNRDQLDEILLDQYKNSGLLRELIRRCLNSLKEQTELTNFYKENPDTDQLDKINEEINKIIDKYK
jgi:hypothetical protein